MKFFNYIFNSNVGWIDGIDVGLGAEQWWFHKREKAFVPVDRNGRFCETIKNIFTSGDQKMYPNYWYKKWNKLKRGV